VLPTLKFIAEVDFNDVPTFYFTDNSYWLYPCLLTYSFIYLFVCLLYGLCARYVIHCDSEDRSCLCFVGWITQKVMNRLWWHFTLHTLWIF